MWSRFETVEKVTTKGYPQESVLGPFLWNVSFDDAQCQTDADETKIAFAGVLLVIVSGRSRRRP